MTDKQSTAVLAVNFVTETFAYRRLAQGPSGSLSAFSSSLREKFETFIRDYQCGQNVDDIGLESNTVQRLIKTLRAVYQCPRKAGLKLSTAKCHFEVQEEDFIGRTITTKGVAPQKQR